MNLVDMLLALVVLLSTAAGWRRGFVYGALDLLSLVASVLLAFWGYPYPARFIEQHFGLASIWAMPLAFIASYILARIVLGSLAGSLARAVPQRTQAHAANRALGLAPGFVNGLINAMIVAIALVAVPLVEGLTTQVRGSVVVARLTLPAEWLESQLAPIFDGAVSKALSRMTVKPESRESIPLTFTVQNPKPRPDLEARMLELLNEERAKAGLGPLRMDPELTEVARAHSKDMFARGYFAHVTPEGKDPFDRMRQARVRYLTAGENLALARTLPMAHEGLMNSPGHRANILRPAFGRVGIGVLDGGVRGQMVTQNFRN